MACDMSRTTFSSHTRLPASRPSCVWQAGCLALTAPGYGALTTPTPSPGRLYRLHSAGFATVDRRVNVPYDAGSRCRCSRNLQRSIRLTLPTLASPTSVMWLWTTHTPAPWAASLRDAVGNYSRPVMVTLCGRSILAAVDGDGVWLLPVHSPDVLTI